MKRIFIVLALIGAFTLASAQDYSTGIGLRGGVAQGITVKHFMGDKSALEGLLSLHWGGFEITGLYEIHSMQLAGVDRLNLYYGAGAHLGIFDGTVRIALDGINIGVDGILGLEYNFEQIPINVSVDYKPAFNIIGERGFWGDGGALSLRYIF